MASQCRLIDHVTVKGSRQPIRLSTIDLDFTGLETSKRKDRVSHKNRYKIRQLREIRKNDKMSDEYHVAEAFQHDPDILLMRKTFAPEFFLRFNMAFRNYEAGEWLVARDMLYTCHYIPESSIE